MDVWEYYFERLSRLCRMFRVALRAVSMMYEASHHRATRKGIYFIVDTPVFSKTTCRVFRFRVSGN
jgi:hypothetical protein